MNPTKEYPRPYVTVDVIIYMGDYKYIMIKRKNPPYGWALPGGFLNEGESLEEAARREVKEETGLTLNDLEQVHTYSDPNRDPRGWIITTVFVADGVGTPVAQDDAKDIMLVDFNNLPDEIAFDHRQIIKDYQEGTHS